MPAADGVGFAFALSLSRPAPHDLLVRLRLGGHPGGCGAAPARVAALQARRPGVRLSRGVPGGPRIATLPEGGPDPSYGLGRVPWAFQGPSWACHEGLTRVTSPDTG